MRILAALNGDRRPDAHTALPVSADQLADDARTAVEAGATAVHVHPRDSHGHQGLDPQTLTPVMAALRDAVPDTALSVTTSLHAEPDPWRRYDLVGRWGRLPDSATVHPHEPGSIEVVRLLNDRRVAVEACVATVEDARILVASGQEFDRVLIRPHDTTTREARETVRRIEALLAQAEVEWPRTLCGYDATAWELLADAVEGGYDLRIGLADTLTRPDGAVAADNAELVRLAVARTATPAHQ